MKYLRYSGEFLDIRSVTWRVELWQEADADFDEVGDLTFDADVPLSIEWGETGKDETICSSEATIKLISPGDRTYEDLYTVTVGAIRMDVYRAGSLYWSGCIDTEFYEEPYESAYGYTVPVTFTDFGVWGRLKYNLSGMQTILSIITDALDRCAINYTSLDYGSFSTTTFEDGTAANIATLSLRSDNFIDEDGEYSTLEEVIEGALRPLGLRIIQRAGTVYIYDYNGLYTSADQRVIEWDGDSQTLGADKVYNNVVITFSPYAESMLQDEEVVYEGEYDVDAVNLTDDNPADATYGEYYSWYPDYTQSGKGNWDYYNIDFTMFLSSSKGSGVASIHNNARYFHILPVLGSAEECSGVAWAFYTGGHGSLASGYPERKLSTVSSTSTSQVLTTNKVYLPGFSDDDRGDYWVRLTLEMLFDPRYNPFESDGEYNESGNYGDVEVYTAWAFVPVVVNLLDADGNAIYHYDNSAIAKNAATGHKNYAFKGEWVEGAGSYGDAFLEWYDPDDLEDSCGILGWATNRHCIGRLDDSADTTVSGYFKSGSELQIYEHFKKMDDGEYMPYPPEGGWLQVTVYAGVLCYNLDESGDWGDTQKWDDKDLYSKIRWQLYKAPQLEVVKNNLVFDEAELDDIEYSGYLNKEAEESLEIDTICGSCDAAHPTAKGTYFRTSDLSQVQTLCRADTTDHPEKLYIGTLYSQFAARKTTLSGEAVIDPEGLALYTEANQDGKVFLMTGEVQDVRMDCTEATFVELGEEDYEAIEEVDD